MTSSRWAPHNFQSELKWRNDYTNNTNCLNFKEALPKIRSQLWIFQIVLFGVKSRMGQSTRDQNKFFIMYGDEYMVLSTLGKSLDFLPKSIFPAFMMWLLIKKWVSEKLRCLSDLNQSLYGDFMFNNIVSTISEHC